MSEQRTNEQYDRKAIVRRLREEGRAAFDAGVKYAACPYRDMDAFQWQQGWSDGQAAHDAEVAQGWEPGMDA